MTRGIDMWAICRSAGVILRDAAERTLRAAAQAEIDFLRSLLPK